MKRKRHKYKGKPPKPKPMPEQIDPGTASATPETRRNFRKSSFARWCDKDEITGEMLRAAQEIEEVYVALTRGLLIKGTSMEKQDKSHGESLSDKIAWAYQSRYKPWADRLSRRQKNGEAPALSVLMDVVIDLRFAETIDREQRWRNGFAKCLCQRALLEYAVMAQWVSQDELTQFDRANVRLQRAA